MWRNRIIPLIITVFFLTICGAPAFAATDYVDDDGNYYVQTSDQVPTWEISIEHLGFVNSDGEEAVVISSSTGAVNIADPNISAGGIAGYFAQDISIAPGTYTQIHLTQGADCAFVGCIYDPVQEQWRATPDGELYSTKQDALDNAGVLDFTFDNGGELDEYLIIDPARVIEEGKTYTLTILWKNYGLEAGIPEEGEPEGDFGVGLIWNPDMGEFTDGMLKDSYNLE